MSGIVVAALGMAVLSGLDPEYASCYMLVLLIAIPVILSASKVFSGELPWFSPHTAMLLGIFFIYVLAPPAMMFYRTPSYITLRAIPPEQYMPALWLSLVAVSCYLLGWRFGPKRQTMPARLEWFLSDTPEVRANFDYLCLAIMIVGFAAWLYIFSFAGGIAGQLENMRTRSESATEAGGIFLRVAMLTYGGVLLYFSRHGVTMLSLAALGFFFFILMVFGSRSYAAMLVVAALAVHTFRSKHKIPLPVWIGIGAGMFVIMTYWVLLRQTQGNLSAAADAYSEQMSSTEGIVTQSLGSFMFMRQHVDWMTAIGTQVPPQYGRTFSVVLNWIPTMIWPNKGDLVQSGSKLYLQTFFPHKIGNVSLSSPLFIEYYVNFMWPGVIVLCFFTGVVVRWLDSVLLRHPHRRFQVAHIVIAGLLVATLIKTLKQGVSQVVVIIDFIVVPILIVYFPNLPLLLSPPANDSRPELGDVPDSERAMAGP